MSAATEADGAARVFQAALAAYGAKAAVASLAHWKDLPTDASPRLRSWWIKKAVSLVIAIRSETYELSVSYYRYIRALKIGVTVQRPGESEDSVRLDQLRREFRKAAGSAASGLSPKGGDVEIKIDRDYDKLLTEAGGTDRAVVQEATTDISALGPNYLSKAVKQIEADLKAERKTTGAENERKKPLTAKEAKRRVAQARSTAGARQAASTSRIVQDGARATLYNAITNDAKAIAWVRVSDGDPCAFCAMLISRGPVYKTKEIALYSDGDKYHDNCNCTVEPIFSRSEYYKSPLFKLNRQYAHEWKQVVGSGGYYGTPLNAFRRHLAAKKRATRSRSKTNETALEASAA